MKIFLQISTFCMSLTCFAQNLLTTNPSFEEYTSTGPTGWYSVGAKVTMVTDATDGSVAVKLQRVSPYVTHYFSFVSSQDFTFLKSKTLGMSLDYKVVSGQVPYVGFVMLPGSYSVAWTDTLATDGEWHHTQTYASLEYDEGIYNDNLHLRVYLTKQYADAEIILDNIVFGYADEVLSTTEYRNAIPQDITIGPNPTTSTITFFDVDKVENKNIAIFDTTGRLVLKTKLVGDVLDLSHLSAGTYILKFGDSFSKKIIKK